MVGVFVAPISNHSKRKSILEKRRATLASKHLALLTGPRPMLRRDDFCEHGPVHTMVTPGGAEAKNDDQHQPVLHAVLNWRVGKPLSKNCSVPQEASSLRRISSGHGNKRPGNENLGIENSWDTVNQSWTNALSLLAGPLLSLISSRDILSLCEMN